MPFHTGAQLSILAHRAAHVDINAFYSFAIFAAFVHQPNVGYLRLGVGATRPVNSHFALDSSADNASITPERGFSFYQGKVAELSTGTRNQPRVRVSGLIENRCKSGSAKKASRRESDRMIRFCSTVRRISLLP